MRYSNQSKEKINGVVYTPRELANYVVQHMLEYHGVDGANIKILDPAIGSGELIEAFLDAVNYKEMNITVYGYETDSRVFAETLEKLQLKYNNVTFHIYNQDFIQSYLDGETDRYDYIIANPPYIRTQILGAEKAQMLAKQFGLTGRIDIYYAFIMIAVKVLKETGIAGFITSNKFLTIKAGKAIRLFLKNFARIYEITDFGDTKLFDAAVLPCTMIFSKDPCHNADTKFTSVYETENGDSNNFTSVFDGMTCDGTITVKNGKHYLIKHGNLTIDKESQIWRLSEETNNAWLRCIERKTWKYVSQIAKIRVGIKTTADNVFIGTHWDNDNPPELLRPLITHRNAGQIVANQTKLWKVLYTHTAQNGKKECIDIERYPISYQYLLQHREQLEKRTYIKEAKRNWYEIWVPQNPASWEKMKIVFRDITEHPQFWIDNSHSVVNGDCYWMDFCDEITEEIICLVLAVANSTFIEKYYDMKFNNKLYSGKRRFMAQYVEQFPIPYPDSPLAQEAIMLVKRIISNPNNHENNLVIKQTIDEIVTNIFE